MMDRRDLLAEGVLSSKALTARFLVGFDDGNRSAQAPGLPNHAAWCLGHCALTMHRSADKLLGLPGHPERGGLPETDFILGGRPDGGGDARRFATESVSFNSRPAADASQYPSWPRCVEIYSAACDRFAAAVRQVPESRLDETTRWGPGEVPLWALGMRMVYHNGVHTGQVVDLRRALGFKGVLG